MYLFVVFCNLRWYNNFRKLRKGKTKMIKSEVELSSELLDCLERLEVAKKDCDIYVTIDQPEFKKGNVVTDQFTMNNNGDTVFVSVVEWEVKKVKVNKLMGLAMCVDEKWNGAMIWINKDYASSAFTYLVDVDSLDQLEYDYRGYKIVEVNGIKCIPLIFTNEEIELLF